MSHRFPFNGYNKRIIYPRDRHTGKQFQLEPLPICRDELSGIDIEKEYAFIQEKRSRLTRRLRDMVVARHEWQSRQKITA